MQEIWKDVKGFEGLYQVSNLGNAKSFYMSEERILKPKANWKTGKLEISLNKNKKRYFFILDRLVYETFYNVKLKRNDIVMHKDEDNNNCELENLYVISRGERQKLTYKEGKRKDKYEFEYYGEILGIKEISERTGIKPQRIRERIYELGWNIYEAAEIPVSRKVK